MTVKWGLMAPRGGGGKIISCTIYTVFMCMVTQCIDDIYVLAVLFLRGQCNIE